MNNLTIAYIIFTIVLLHLVAGFAWVIIKFSKKDSRKILLKEWIWMGVSYFIFLGTQHLYS